MNTHEQFKESAIEKFSEHGNVSGCEVSIALLEDRQYAYRVRACIDNKVIIGAGVTEGRAIDSALSYLAYYDRSFENVIIK